MGSQEVAQATKFTASTTSKALPANSLHDSLTPSILLYVASPDADMSHLAFTRYLL